MTELQTVNSQPVEALDQYMEAVTLALPDNITPARFRGDLNTVLVGHPQLQECFKSKFGKESLFGAVLEAARLGLRPGSNGACYILPFRSKGNMTASFQLGYRGMIELAHRDQRIIKIDAVTVHENDDFSFEEGPNGGIKHKRGTGDRGKASDYYAWAKISNGAIYEVVMSSAEVHEWKEKNSKAPNSPAWKNHFPEMAKKTCIRRLFKKLPVRIQDFSEGEQFFASSIDAGVAVAVNVTPDPENAKPEGFGRENLGYDMDHKWRHAFYDIGKVSHEPCGAPDDKMRRLPEMVAAIEGQEDVRYVEPLTLRKYADEIKGASATMNADGISPRAELVMELAEKANAAKESRYVNPNAPAPYKKERRST